jgi:hypothetical protein
MGFELVLTQREGPFRVQQQLRNLARGLARAHGRTRVTEHELELVRRVALSSLPSDRADVIAVLPLHPDGLSVKACADGIRKKEDRARERLEELAELGLLTSKPGPSNGGRPAVLYTADPKFADLLTKPMFPLDHALDLHTEDFPGNSNRLLTK